MKKPAIINCCEELKKEIELLYTLWNIEATINTMNLNKPKQKIIDKHPMDDFYDKMKCKLIHLDEENKMRKTIGDVLRDTKCPTHTWYKYEVMSVFEIERLTKQDKFFEKIPNRKLL
uniref:NAD(+) ADP-ribosyltransferase n=1 Tax=Parastrongyloides trichosuri TaxID=131310 RepID=A0A0N4ZDW0_PARTI